MLKWFVALVFLTVLVRTGIARRAWHVIRSQLGRLGLSTVLLVAVFGFGLPAGRALAEQAGFDYGLSCMEATSRPMPHNIQTSGMQVDIKCHSKAPPPGTIGKFSINLATAYDAMVQGIHNGMSGLNVGMYLVNFTTGSAASHNCGAPVTYSLAARGDFVKSGGTVLDSGGFSGPEGYFHIVMECATTGFSWEVRQYNFMSGHNNQGSCNGTTDAWCGIAQFLGGTVGGVGVAADDSFDCAGVGGASDSTCYEQLSWACNADQYDQGSHLCVEASNWLSWDAMQPNYFGETDPFADSACESLDLEIQRRPFGGGTFETLITPGGTMAGRGDLIRVVVTTEADLDPEDELSLAIRFDTTARWDFADTITMGDLPRTFEWEHPGPPNDLGEMEIRCQVTGQPPEFWDPVDIWDDTLNEPRPCLGWDVNWNNVPEIVRSGVPYLILFTPPADAVGEVTGLFLDGDDMNDAGEIVQYRDEFDPDDEDSYLANFNNIFRSQGNTEEHEFRPEPEAPVIEWDIGEAVEGGVTLSMFYVSFTASGPGTLDKAGLGLWCTDEDGDPILYAADGTHDPLDPPVDDAESCAGGSGMSLTSPSTWVRGIGRMLTCLLQELFVPESDVVSELWDGLVEEVETNVPFAWVFAAYDMITDGSSGMQGAVSANRDDCVQVTPSGGEILSTDAGAMCPGTGQVPFEGLFQSARPYLGGAVWLFWAWSMYGVVFGGGGKGGGGPTQLTLADHFNG